MAYFHRSWEALHYLRTFPIEPVLFQFWRVSRLCFVALKYRIPCLMLGKKNNIFNHTWDDGVICWAGKWTKLCSCIATDCGRIWCVFLSPTNRALNQMKNILHSVQQHGKAQQDLVILPQNSLLNQTCRNKSVSIGCVITSNYFNGSVQWRLTDIRLFPLYYYGSDYSPWS